MEHRERTQHRQVTSARPNSSDRRVVAFSADAQVLDRREEYPVGRLGPGRNADETGFAW